MSGITYEWNFNPLEVVYNEETLSNVVNVVHWQYRAVDVDSGTMVQNIGTISLGTPSVESFIPFENLTKETVATWVETRLGEDTITSMQTSLSGSLNNKLFPVSGPVSPPWDVVPTP